MEQDVWTSTNAESRPLAVVRRVRSSLPWLPVIVAVIGGASMSIFRGISGHIIVFISSLFVIGWLAARLVRIVIAAWRGRWRLSAGHLLRFIVAVPLAFYGLRSGDYAHLAIFYPNYALRIAKTTTRPVFFDWGHDAGWFTDGLQETSLAYDDTGSIDANAPKGAIRTIGGIRRTYSHLVGNFFVAHDSAP